MHKKVIFDKKISLVIGGAGFIGSNLCEELLKTSKVICVDDFSSGNEKNIDHLLSEPDFEFVNHDMSTEIDLESLPELQKFKIKFQGIQDIYNLACPMSINDFNKNKIKVLLANSLVVKNALDLALKYEAKFLHFSSSVVYGDRSKNPGKIEEAEIGKSDFLSSRSSYDEGKRFAETMVMNYRREASVDAKIIRVFRTYGPKMQLFDSQIIPDFINAALENKPITIYGDENFTTSLCYISDLLDAVNKIMDSDFFGPVNIGSDVEINLTHVANKIKELTNSSSEIVYKKELEFLSPLCFPDINLAKKSLGWLPIVTLEKGLQETVHHLQVNKGLKDIRTIQFDNE